MSHHAARRSSRVPDLLVPGILLILLAEALVFTDFAMRGGAVVPGDPLPDPEGWLEIVARQGALNLTPICWIGYLLVLDGILARAGGSPARLRPLRFGVCFLASVPIWLYFDWINFWFMDAWRYHNLPASIWHRYTGYFIAFGAICPAMFTAAELVQRLGLRWWRTSAVRLNAWCLIVIYALGVACTVLPFLLRDPLANFALWVAPALLLDPINLVCGGPSILGDWRRGRPGRTVSLMAGGLLCGLLWEFWNYWAVAKWTYHLPFLGPLEDVRYFEMPVPGLAGFLPFAVSCWVMFNTIVLLLRKAGLRRLEPLPEPLVV